MKVFCRISNYNNQLLRQSFQNPFTFERVPMQTRRRNTYRFSRSTPSFTLIELLTVIAVLLVLFSLVLPALAKARKKTFTIRCQNNLRQIGVAAISMYTTDYDGYAMPADFGSPLYSWANYLSGKDDMGDPQLYACPSYGKRDCFNPYGGTASARVGNSSYVMNTIKKNCWGSATLDTDPAKSRGWCNGTRNPVRMNRVNQPASTVVMVEARKSLPSADARGIIHFNETDRGGSGALSDTGHPHQGRFNVLWGDNHIEPRFHTSPHEWVARGK